MPIPTDALERIKRAVSDDMAQAMSQLGIDTGTGRSLMLTALEAIDRAAADPTEPGPFAADKRVHLIGNDTWGRAGTVVENRKDMDGMVHTVRVRWDHMAGTQLHSPQELEELA